MLALERRACKLPVSHQHLPIGVLHQRPRGVLAIAQVASGSSFSHGEPQSRPHVSQEMS